MVTERGFCCSVLVSYRSWNRQEMWNWKFILFGRVFSLSRVTCLGSETMKYSDIHLGLSHCRLWAQLRRRSPFYRKFFLLYHFT